MHFQQYDDIHRFYRDVFPVLLRHEAQNVIPLGNVILAHEGRDKTGWRDPAHWLMATVTDGAEIVLTAVMTPPFNLTLYATDNHAAEEAITCLLAGILKANIALPGVTTEQGLATRFAKAYTTATGLHTEVQINQRIYELTQVNPGIAASGCLRPAKESDMAFLPFWLEGFQTDCFATAMRVQSDAEVYRYHIASGKLFVLEADGMPVSMAKINRELVTLCGVGYVYTPPYLRGKGYATACVAALSRLILARGFARCVLYTDLANPTSNSIYQKIGYTPICDSQQLLFL